MTDTEMLAAARLFQSDNPEVARRLAGLRPRARSVAAAQTIFAAGDPADSIYLLAPAKAFQPGPDPLVQVRLAQNGSGPPLRYGRVVRGDIFGEVELVGAGLDPRQAVRVSTARALTPSRIIPLAWSELARLFDLDPLIRTRFLRIASRRLLDAVFVQHSQGHEDAEIVLADWLVELAADLGVAASNRVSFPKRISQSEIADEIGVSRETVSRRLKEWERAGLVVTSAAGLEVVDYSRLVRIAGLHSGRGRDALARAVADVAAEIDRGDLPQARNIGADMLRYFPSSPQLLHLVALAAARSGDGEEAVAVLRGAQLAAGGDLEALRGQIVRGLQNPFASSERLAAGEAPDAFSGDDAAEPQDPGLLERLVTDIAALEARLLKDQAFAADGSLDREQARRSAHSYGAIYRKTGNWYAGVNAASMALAAGRSDEARRLAGEIAARLDAGPKTYWGLASLAEARFVSGDRQAGLAALDLAAAAPDGTDSAKASTMLQLRRLAPLLGLDLGDARQRLALPAVAVVTGHMFRGAEMDAQAQSRAGEAVWTQAHAILRARNVGHVYGALACGGDIVVAEAALDLGVEFHAVLPFPVARFAELSVRLGDPPDSPGAWQKRFEHVLGRAASLTLADDEAPLDRDLDGHFFYGFRFMAGLALLRAAMLQAECRLIAVSDGTQPKNIAGSNRAVADWAAAGRAVDPIRFPFPRRAPAGRPRGASSFRPCVFLWDNAGSRADLAAIARAGLAGNAGLSIVARTSRLGHEGSCIVVATLQRAIELARSLADGNTSLRIICDFGPVLGADLEADPKLVTRLKAGSDLPGFPSGRPLATLAFAAQALAEFGDRLDVRAVGRAEEARLDGEAGARARRRSGLPVFRLALRDAGGPVSPADSTQFQPAASGL